MYQPLIKFHPYPAIITQVLRIFVRINAGRSETFVRSPHDCGSGETPSPSGGNNTKADR